MATVRLGFIGSGGNARGHMKRVATFPDAEIVAISDVDETAMKLAVDAVPTLAEVPKFTDYLEMLDSVELDAVEISTPHTLHFEQAMNALDRGLHVLVEKPMVCSVEHARKLIAKAKETGKVLLVSYQRHFASQYRYIRDLIARGGIGEIQYVAGLQGQDWYRGQFSRNTWRVQPELSGGGQLNDSGSHLLDIILWMTGLKADVVSAYIENLEAKVDINSAISLRFASGAIGTISVIGNSPNGMWEEITIGGSKGMIILRNGALTIQFFSGETKKPAPEEMPPGSSPDRNFIDAVLGRDEVESPGECGLRVIELTEAAWESARTGQPVHVAHAEA